MKNGICFVVLLMGLFSCKPPLSKNLELPDATLINEIISNVILLDSLNGDYKIKDSISTPIIYSLPKDSNGLPPPPPLPFSISYAELYTHFNSRVDEGQLLNDSVFIMSQINNSRNILLSKDIVIKFNNNNSNFYLFYLPIFSSNKELVLVQYWMSCGPLCGTCYQTLLKRMNSKWILVNRWTCGVS